MKITKVSYGKTFNLGSYSSERIDMEMEITEDESSLTALASLKDIVEGFHKQANPHLSQESAPSYSMAEREFISTNIPTANSHLSIEEKISPEQEINDLLTEISNATAETLEQWKIPALRNIKTKGAYNLRKKQLNIQ